MFESVSNNPEQQTDSWEAEAARSIAVQHIPEADVDAAVAAFLRRNE